MKLTITRPDDWHLHVRDGAALAAVLPDTCRQMGRAIIMPNLKPPVTTVEMAAAYRERILAARPAGSSFEPLMTLYLTETTTAEEVRKAKASGFVHGIKLYPAGATTNSDAGVRDVNNAMVALEAMAEVGMPLLVHGEVTDPAVDVFDREAVFIDTVFEPLLKRLPTLRVVFEHITTRQAAEYVASAGDNIAATITAQGTDSAPHARNTKENACGCAGMYTANVAIELYAEAFDAAGALDKLEAFASFNGPDFYQLPRNTDTLSLVREAWQVPAALSYGNDELVPLRAGEYVQWRCVP